MLALASVLLAIATAQGALAPAGTVSPSAAEAEAQASPVSVTATASKAEVTVGEAFAIELKATGPAGTTYTFAGEASADELELRSPVTPKDAPAPEPGTHRYEATVFALGELQIPPLPVRYRLPDGTEGEAASAPLSLKVVSLLPKEEAEQKLADIRGPASVGVGRAFWIVLAGLLMLVAAIAILLLRRKRQAIAPLAATEPELAPDVEALRALEVLARRGLPARGELRPFYIRLSAIAKRYLERRLGAPIVEMTSAETLSFLRAHPHGGELLAVVRDLAEAADRVKFARAEGLVPEAERHLASVKALVAALEAKLRPAPPVETEGKAA
jgi:hypothetical protein